jgi:hypothetical protein
MKRHRLLCRVLAASAAALLLTGCGDSKKAREARMTGIEQMNQENYEDAIASFDKALDEADGTYDIVGDLKRKVAESYRTLRHISIFQITTYAVTTLGGMALVVMILLQLRIWKTMGFL